MSLQIRDNHLGISFSNITFSKPTLRMGVGFADEINFLVK